MSMPEEDLGSQQQVAALADQVATLADGENAAFIALTNERVALLAQVVTDYALAKEAPNPERDQLVANLLGQLGLSHIVRASALRPNPGFGYGSKLQQYKERNNLTIEELALLLDRSSNTVRRVLKQNNASLPVRQRIDELLGADHSAIEN